MEQITIQGATLELFQEELQDFLDTTPTEIHSVTDISQFSSVLTVIIIYTA